MPGRAVEPLHGVVDDELEESCAWDFALVHTFEEGCAFGEFQCSDAFSGGCAAGFVEPGQFHAVALEMALVRAGELVVDEVDHACFLRAWVLVGGDDGFG